MESTILKTKNSVLRLALFIVLVTCSFCTKNETSSTATTSQLVEFNVDGVAKKFTIQAIKVGSLISISGTLQGVSGRISSETISFKAYENELATSIYNFSYTVNGVTYTQNTGFQSSLTQHSNGRLKGTFSGTIEDANGIPKIISPCSFDFTYSTEAINTITGTYVLQGTTYTGACSSVVGAIGCATGISVIINAGATESETFVIHNMPQASSGTFPFFDAQSVSGPNICNLFAVKPGNSASGFISNGGGTLTKTGAKSFTFSCDVKSGGNVPTNTVITGGGSY